ncbi:deoxynucleoside kinase [Longibacter salinarum]|uniref:Deoxynucleoside kinase n=1 Tax=Longibacter salinarum TaxID=1850348 RepID=A0A2A8CYF4_9BACT|nr:deoxynucleoside kinase [Longibacter salinarum]PEN13752.1 deoxynucleoside kinase [Longibacter salinarum]
MPDRSSPSVSLPDDLGYLVIEGVIGAGKTTLAQLLTEAVDGRIVLEQFKENPFLERFYENKDRWAFQTELTFLASRFKQQKDLGARDLFHRIVVSDYAFDKNRIFAHQTLSGDELQLFETLYSIMEPNVPTPDLIVYLQSSPERLMENIRKRDRSYERSMDPAYIQSLHEAYDHYFRTYRKTPLLIVNAAEIDFVEHEKDLEVLLHHIANADLDGTTYVDPVVERS